MKSGTYFQSNPPIGIHQSTNPNSSGSYYSHQSKTYNPYTSSSKPSYEFGHKMNLLQPGPSGSGTKVINGIRLVGLAAQSPKGSKWSK